MELIKKLEILGTAAKYDVCASSSTNKKAKNSAIGNGVPSGVCHSFTPDGRCISLFKVLMTNECQKDCIYCQNRCQRNTVRTHFDPDELVKLFMQFYTRNYIEGLFLSSGVRKTSNQTMEDMIKVIEALRYKHKFGGYIHLKILPGADEPLIERAVELSNRVSVNLEVPNQQAMNRLSHRKDFNKEILGTLGTIGRYIGKHQGVTQTTQFMVGAAQESDQEIITTVFNLYDRYRLKRAYFSAFQPIPNTPLENSSPTSLLREHRLYQTDFLIRQYGFQPSEVLFESNGNLNPNMDPKLFFAIKNLELFPIEINKASMAELLRIPGIGPISARRIQKLRRHSQINSLEMLKHMGVVVKRATPFILIQGKSYGSIEELLKGETPKYEQLSIDQFVQNIVV